MRKVNRRHGFSTLVTFALAGVFAAAGTLAAPAAALTVGQLVDPRLAASLLGAGIAQAAAHPGLLDLARSIEGSDAISRGSDGRLTVLLVGSDYRPSLAGERTDTLIVMTIHPGTKQISAISIPRDISRVKLPNGTTYAGRINTMYAHYRKALGSAAAALARLEQIIEFNLQVEIDYYALIRMPAFEELIDHIAGVSVSIPTVITDPKFWDSPLGPQGIYFPASTAWPLKGKNSTLCNGYYKTNQLSKPGAQCQRALVYSRTRKGPGNSDFKRARRQQTVVAAAIAKVRSRGSSNLSALLTAGNAQVTKGNVITNIPRTAADVLELYNLFANAKLVNQAVLKPKKYAVKNVGSATYTLKLVNVRALTKLWFTPVN